MLAKSSTVAGKLFNNTVSKKVLSNIHATLTYKQFTNMPTCCFVWADKEELGAIQIHQTENYFICVNRILMESAQLETSKAQYR